MDNAFQEEMREFKEEVRERFKQNDAFQEEMHEFKEEVREKFKQNDAFQKEMYEFKEEVREKFNDFQEEMREFKEEVREKFKQNDAFQKEMYEFKDATNHKLDALAYTLNEVHKAVLLIEHNLHDKTSALFDAYSSNNDKHVVIDARLYDLENLTLKNSAKISVLEDTTRLAF